MKKIISLLLVALLAFSLLPVYAFAEGEAEPESVTEAAEGGSGYKAEEVVYGILGADGKTEKLVPVVIIDAQEDTSLTYYGDFSEVLNLSDTKELDFSDGGVQLELPKGRMYFRGELISAETPWIINIEYYMDGEKVAPEELGGKSGHLEIKIDIKKNENADASYFDNYLAQVSLSLNSEKCQNIVAEGATMANAGANKMINFMSMPGTESEFTVSADVQEFSMGGMSIAAVPLSMADMLNDESMDELTNGLQQLSYGVSTLNDGAWQLSSGMSQFSDGLNQLSAGSESLRSGSAQILEGMKKISEIAGSIGQIGGDIDLSNITLLPQALYAVADGLDSAAGTVDGMKNSVDAFVAQVGTPLDSVTTVDEAQLNALLEANPDNAALQSLINNSNQALAAKAGWDANRDAVNQVSSGLTVASELIRTQAGQIRTVAASLEELINSEGGGDVSSDISAQLQQLASLGDNYQMFHDGLVQYTGGVDALAEASRSLAGGTEALAGGTSQLNNGTSAIPGEVDSMLNPGDGEFVPHSFLSDKNENVSAVQFVFSTQGIELPQAEETEAETEAEPTGFALLVDRFLDLFRKDEE